MTVCGCGSLDPRGALADTVSPAWCRSRIQPCATHAPAPARPSPGPPPRGLRARERHVDTGKKSRTTTHGRQAHSIHGGTHVSRVNCQPRRAHAVEQVCPHTSHDKLDVAARPSGLARRRVSPEHAYLAQVIRWDASHASRGARREWHALIERSLTVPALGGRRGLLRPPRRPRRQRAHFFLPPPPAFSFLLAASSFLSSSSAAASKTKYWPAFFCSASFAEPFLLTRGR